MDRPDYGRVRRRAAAGSSLPVTTAQHSDATTVEFVSREDAEARRREAREQLRSESSEEEGLEPELFCTVCGSTTCYRYPTQCRPARRLALCESLIEGFLKEGLQCRDGWQVYVRKLGQESLQYFLAAQEELEKRKSRAQA